MTLGVGYILNAILGDSDEETDSLFSETEVGTVDMDTDGDGIVDTVAMDTDNDGIADTITSENQIKKNNS